MGKLTKHVSLFYVVASFSVSCLAAHVGQRFSGGREVKRGGGKAGTACPIVAGQDVCAFAACRIVVGERGVTVYLFSLNKESFGFMEHTHIDRQQQYR